MLSEDDDGIIVPAAVDCKRLRRFVARRVSQQQYIAAQDRDEKCIGVSAVLAK